MIRVQEVVKTFGAVRALGPVSFAVPSGAQVALLGESGSGKSTLLNLLGCMETPSSGAVLLDGEDTARLADAALCRLRLRAIGYVHQFFDLVSDLTALENVMVPLWLAGVAGRAKSAHDAADHPRIPARSVPRLRLVRLTRHPLRPHPNDIRPSDGEEGEELHAIGQRALNNALGLPLFYLAYDKITVNFVKSITPPNINTMNFTK